MVLASECLFLAILWVAFASSTPKGQNRSTWGTRKTNFSDFDMDNFIDMAAPRHEAVLYFAQGYDTF